MTYFSRFKKLSIWNKISVIGALLTIVWFCVTFAPPILTRGKPPSTDANPSIDQGHRSVYFEEVDATMGIKVR